MGHGYCDFPEFNAKYGTYSLVSKQRNLILDFHFIQVTTVDNSLQIEKADLKHLGKGWCKGNENIFFNNR